MTGNPPLPFVITSKHAVSHTLGEIPNSIVVVFKVMVIQPFIHQIIDHTKREKSHRLIMKYLRQTLDILVRLNTNKTENNGMLTL